MALIVARRVWRVNATAIVRSIPFVVNGRREPSAGECRSDFSYGKHCFPWVHRRRTLRRSSAVAVPLIIAHQSTSTVSFMYPEIYLSSRDEARATRSRHRRREIGLSLLSRGATVRRKSGTWSPSPSRLAPRSVTRASAIRNPCTACPLRRIVENK